MMVTNAMPASPRRRLDGAPRSEMHHHALQLPRQMSDMLMGLAKAPVLSGQDASIRISIVTTSASVDLHILLLVHRFLWFSEAIACCDAPSGRGRADSWQTHQ